MLVIHKPEASERPLWDYPDGTLVARERAAYLISAAGGFDVVPPTVLRNGPLGPGSVQLWVGPVEGAPEPLVDVTPADAVPEGWVVVIEGESPGGRPVVVSHSREPAAAHRGGVRRRAQQLRPQGRRTCCATATSCAAATTGSASGSSRSCAPCCGAGRGSRCPTPTSPALETLLDALGDGLRRRARRPADPRRGASAAGRAPRRCCDRAGTPCRSRAGRPSRGRRCSRGT